MSATIQKLGIDQMNVEERIRLIGEIRDSLTLAGGIELPESHRGGA